MPPDPFVGTVTVASFNISQYETTWGEWKTVRAWASSHGYDIGAIGAGSADTHPVQSVNWYDAVKWCNAKSEMEGLTPVYSANGSIYRTGEFGVSPYSVVTQNAAASGYRLPTEPEWGWAARGGSLTHGYMYSGSNTINDVAWYYENSSGAAVDMANGHGTWPVGQKAANELGLYDMSGNVYEWCWANTMPGYTSYPFVRGGSYFDMAGRSMGCAVTDGMGEDAVTRQSYFGFRAVRSVTTPEMAVEQPSGTALQSNATATAFGASLLAVSSAPRTYTIRNTGAADLTNLALTKNGTNAADFSVSALSVSTIPAGNSTTFTVTFNPSGGRNRTAQLSIASNDSNSPFLINLTGFGLSKDVDTDGDELNDAAEYKMAALGFDWQVSQPALVKALTDNINTAGYYSTTQVHALNIGAPLLTQNPASGLFKLTIAVKKSTDLQTFTSMPLSDPNTFINAQGEIECEFSVPGKAAFFRLESR